MVLSVQSFSPASQIFPHSTSKLASSISQKIQSRQIQREIKQHRAYLGRVSGVNVVFFTIQKEKDRCKAAPILDKELKDFELAPQKGRLFMGANGGFRSIFEPSLYPKEGSYKWKWSLSKDKSADRLILRAGEKNAFGYVGDKNLHHPSLAGLKADGFAKEFNDIVAGGLFKEEGGRIQFFIESGHYQIEPESASGQLMLDQMALYFELNHIPYVKKESYLELLPN